MNKELLSSQEQGALMFASVLFKDRLSPQYLYHDYNHTLETIGMCQEMAQYYSLADKEHHILILASIFHDIGHIIDYRTHELESAKIAKEYLTTKSMDEEMISSVEELILSTQYDYHPQNLLQEILHDADIINIGKKSFFDKGKFLRIEWEYFLGKRYSDNEWEKLQYDFLCNKKFLTTYAQENYGNRRNKNIEKQRAILEGKFSDKI